MCRSSPLNVAARNVSASGRASDAPITREPRQSTFRSSCSTAWRARIGVVAHGGANAGKLARRNRRADAAAAHHDAAIGLSVAHRLGHALPRCRGSPPAPWCAVPRSMTSWPPLAR